MTRKSWFGVVLLALVGGFYSPAEGGTVILNVYQSSWYENTSGSSGRGTASIQGNFVVDEIEASLYLSANESPSPGDIGFFTLAFYGLGFIPQGPEGLDYLLDHDLYSTKGMRTNTVYSVEDDWGKYILFDPELNLWGSAASQLNLDWTGAPHTFFYTDFNVIGGIITSVDTYAESNEWTGEGEPPTWFDEVRVATIYSGVITSPNFTVVPEPATLILLALGGGASIWRSRRRLA